MPTQIRIKLPAPHAAQRQVLAEAKRFNVLSCGRRFGKTTLGIDRIVKPALESFPTAWFAPNYKTLLEAWRSIQETLAPVIVSRNNAEFRLELRGGGSVTMFSLDTEVSETTRGRAFKCVVVDEAALVKNLKATWENAIRATLADHKGDAWFLSTPRGMNDFKAFYDRGQDTATLYILEDDLGIKVHSVTEPCADDDEGRLGRGMKAVFAEYHGKKIRRTTMRGSRTFAHEPGRYMGGRRPFGYQIVGTKRAAHYELDETEAPIMCQIFERITGGQTGSTVGRWLELDLKIKTTTGGTLWRASRIQAMIHNPLYKGVFIHGRHTDDPIERSVPRIVSDAQWEAAQKAMRKNRTLSRRNSKFPYLLRGMLKCKHCGRTYIGTKGFEPSYRCLGRAHARQLLGADAVHLRCTSPSLNLRVAEDLVFKYVEYALKNDIDTMEQLRQNIAANAIVDPKQKVRLEAQLERKLQAKTNFAMQAAEDNMDQETRRRGSQNFDDEITTLRRQLTELNRAQETTARQLEQLPSVRASLKKLRQIFSQPLTFATMRTILEMAVDRVDVETITDANGRSSVKLHAHLRFIVNASPIRAD